MSTEEVAELEKSPWLDEMLRVRSWDEQARLRIPNAVVPGLEAYREMLEAYLAR